MVSEVSWDGIAVPEGTACMRGFGCDHEATVYVKHRSAVSRRDDYCCDLPDARRYARELEASFGGDTAIYYAPGTGECPYAFECVPDELRGLSGFPNESHLEEEEA